MKKIKTFSQTGFTLIELLIVIAILGVLAVVILLALNPVQQLARTRDTGRIAGITQLGHAGEAFATSNNGQYPAESSTWITTLVTAGEIGTVPAPINYSITGIGACAVNAQNGYCYDASASDGDSPAVFFARLESQANIARCIAEFPTSTQAYAIYATALGRGGIFCGTGVPTAGTTFSTSTNLLP